MALLASPASSPWPPGLTRSAISHCPTHLRADAVQSAWVAVSEGRKPDSAVRALIRHEQRHKSARPNLDRCTRESVRRRF